MGNLIQAFLGLFRYHKKKIFVGFLGFLVSLWMLFPFNDLSNLVTTKVAELTQNQIFIQFNDLGLSLLPSPGISMEQVYVETPFAPPISAGSISISPSLLGLITFNPGFSAQADDIFGGSASFSSRGDSKTAAGKPTQKVDVSFDNVKLGEIMKLANLPIKADGDVSLESTARVDTSLAEQPQGTATVSVTSRS